MFLFNVIFGIIGGVFFIYNTTKGRDLVAKDIPLLVAIVILGFSGCVAVFFPHIKKLINDKIVVNLEEPNKVFFKKR